MTENRRIFLNVLVTYGRSLYALAIGLLTARWVISALGVTDYGLYGVIGGFMGFIGFLNWTLAAANGRFYEIAIGKARTASDRPAALEECRRWFNTALSIHAVVPLALILIGYPIGVCLIKSFLTIPPDRIADCVWVFRFTCFSCLAGMLNVPFAAMFNAKQRLAEITLYSCLASTATVAFLYYMVSHPGVWLVKYALWMCLASVVPQALICVRAVWLFPECRISGKYLMDVRRIKEVGTFAGWNLLAETSALLRINGVGLLVNKALGPKVNAAIALGGSVNGHVSSLSNAVIEAFMPAITIAYGSGNRVRMEDLAYRASKLGFLLLAVFMVPLVAELPFVLKAWLVAPPEFLAFICLAELTMQFMEIGTRSHLTVVCACGKVRECQSRTTAVSLFTLPAAITAVMLGGGVYAIGAVLIAARTAISVLRVWNARAFGGLAIAPWIRRVVFPVALSVGCASLAAWMPRLLMPEGFVRLCVTVAAGEFVLLPLIGFVVLSEEERAAVKMELSRLGLWPFGIIRSR